VPAINARSDSHPHQTVERCPIAEIPPECINSFGMPTDDTDWETVHTVDESFDGPRAGVADFHGVPHAYKCKWNTHADDWETAFELSPLGDEQREPAARAVPEFRGTMMPILDLQVRWSTT
jgi:hypothetical protein